MEKLTNAERAILMQIGRISYGKPGRPSNKKKSLIAQIAAIDALIQLKQSRKKPNDQ